MSLSTTKDKLVFTSIGDWGRRGSNQRAVARQLGEWSEEHDSAFTAAIGQCNNIILLFPFISFSFPSYDLEIGRTEIVTLQE